MLIGQGRYEKAGELHRTVISIYQEKLGREHPAIATALNSWAGMLKTQVRRVGR